MADFFNPEDKIECLASKIISRKCNFESQQYRDDLGRVTSYSFEYNAKIEIEKELEPKEAKLYKSSHLDLGDTLNGEKIYCLTNEKKKLKYNVKSHSGRHEAEFLNTRDYTFANIKYPYLHILNANLKREKLSLNPKISNIIKDKN